MKKNLNKIIKILISIQFIILPFLDILRTTSFRHIEFLQISLIELINILLICSSLLLTIIKIFKNKLIHILGLYIYILLFFVYIYLHYKHITTFDKNIFSMSTFSFTTETFYILRVYLLPQLLLFILFENKDIFNKKFYFKVAKIVILIICLSIIILDLFKISFISYSANHNFVKYNFLDYFLYTGDYKLISARGWFDSANELSAVLLMLFPINVYLLYKEKKKFNILLLASQFLAMIILGTRTAAICPTLISIVSISVYLFLVKLKKEKMDKNFLTNLSLITLIFTAYMLISPFMFGRINDSNFDFSIQNENAYNELENIDDLDEKQLDKLMKKYSSEYLINEAFLDLYPFSNDREFWLKMAKRNRALNNDSRRMKTDIIARIKERNNNKYDNYYGLGYTLNFMDIERDYVYQYYLFGLIGIILFILPYFIFILIMILKMLLNIKCNIKYKTLFGFICPLLGLAIAYLSGHVFGWVSPMMWLVFALGILYNTIDRKEVVYDE